MSPSYAESFVKNVKKGAKGGLGLRASGAVLVVLLSLTRSANWIFTSSMKSKMQRRLSQDSESSGSAAGDVGVWVSMMVMAALMKLTSSTDDVVWLLPFLSGVNKRRNMFVYVACMQCVVLLAWIFTFGGEALLSRFIADDSDWPLERILSLISAVLLTVFTLKLFHDWWKEVHEAAEDDGEDAPTTKASENCVGDTVTEAKDIGAQSDHISNPEVLGVKSGVADQGSSKPDKIVSEDGCRWSRQTSSQSTTATDSGEESQHTKAPDKNDQSHAEDAPDANPATLTTESIQTAVEDNATSSGTIVSECVAGKSADKRGNTANGTDQVELKKYTVSKLCTISLMGSLDDFAVQVSIMLAGVVSASQMLVGVLLGSVIVVGVCLGAGLFSCVVRCLERIPLWSIIGAFAIWTYIATFVMND